MNDYYLILNGVIIELSYIEFSRLHLAFEHTAANYEVLKSIEFGRTNNILKVTNEAS